MVTTNIDMLRVKVERLLDSMSCSCRVAEVITIEYYEGGQPVFLTTSNYGHLRIENSLRNKSQLKYFDLLYGRTCSLPSSQVWPMPQHQGEAPFRPSSRILEATSVVLQMRTTLVMTESLCTELVSKDRSFLYTREGFLRSMRLA